MDGGPLKNWELNNALAPPNVSLTSSSGRITAALRPIYRLPALQSPPPFLVPLQTKQPQRSWDNSRAGPTQALPQFWAPRHAKAIIMNAASNSRKPSFMPYVSPPQKIQHGVCGNGPVSTHTWVNSTPTCAFISTDAHPQIHTCAHTQKQDLYYSAGESPPKWHFYSATPLNHITLLVR